MKTQMQTLIFAEPLQAQEELRVGLVQPLNSPYNLFVNVEDLLAPNTLEIRFYIYSIGAQRNILWGVYYKDSGLFEIDAGCQYVPRELYEITRNWIRSGYEYVGNSVTDRPNQIINQYLDKPQNTYNDYTKMKYLHAYLTNAISDQDYLSMYESLPQDIPDDPNAYIEYLLDLEEKITKYEASINRTDLNRQLLQKLSGSLRKSLVEITQNFAHAVERGDYSMLSRCPTQKECFEGQWNASCRIYYEIDYGDFR